MNPAAREAYPDFFLLKSIQELDLTKQFYIFGESDKPIIGMP